MKVKIDAVHEVTDLWLQVAKTDVLVLGKKKKSKQLIA